jgi:hypothetical protein
VSVEQGPQAVSGMEDRRVRSQLEIAGAEADFKEKV